MNMRNGYWLSALLLIAACGGSGGESRVGNINTNRAPVADDLDFTILEDEVLDDNFSGSDPNGDTIFFAVLDPPDFGRLDTPGGGGGVGQDVSNSRFTYTPAPNFHGVVSFTFTVNDGFLSGAEPGTVTVTVTPVNDPPVAEDDMATTAVDTPVNIPVLDNDSDVDGDSLTLLDVDFVTVEMGMAVIGDNGTPGDASDDVVEYTPAAGFVGTDTFTYTIDDGNENGMADATVEVTVEP